MSESVVAFSLWMEALQEIYHLFEALLLPWFGKYPYHNFYLLCIQTIGSVQNTHCTSTCTTKYCSKTLLLTKTHLAHQWASWRISLFYSQSSCQHHPACIAAKINRLHSSSVYPSNTCWFRTFPYTYRFVVNDLAFVGRTSLPSHDLPFWWRCKPTLLLKSICSHSKLAGSKWWCYKLVFELALTLRTKD